MFALLVFVSADTYGAGTLTPEIIVILFTLYMYRSLPKYTTKT